MMKSKPFRSLIGSLMYLACGMRPDIAVAVAKLSRFLQKPGQAHLDAAIKVMRYLSKTKDVGITYDLRGVREPNRGLPDQGYVDEDAALLDDGQQRRTQYRDVELSGGVVSALRRHFIWVPTARWHALAAWQARGLMGHKLKWTEWCDIIG
jgi:hypothetical protein